jgi:hypothetical protein
MGLLVRHRFCRVAEEGKLLGLITAQRTGGL